MSAESRGSQGEVFLDARGNGRALRLTWHHEVDVVVLSLWREDFCAGTFRLSADDVNAFIDALVDGIRDAPGVHAAQPAEAAAPPPVQRCEVSQPVVDAPRPLAEPRQRPPLAASTSESFSDWAFGADSPRATA